MPKKNGEPTRKEKSEANKAAYEKTRKQIGKHRPRAAREYVPPPREELPPEETNGQVLARKRGNRTDEDCANEILDRVACGDTLTDALEMVGLSMTQWRGWKVNDRFDLKRQYEFALECQAEAWADDLIKEAEAANEDTVQVCKLRIDTKKWLMGRNNIRFQERSNVVHSGSAAPAVTINMNMSAQEAAAEYAKTLKTIEHQ